MSIDTSNETDSAGKPFKKIVFTDQHLANGDPITAIIPPASADQPIKVYSPISDAADITSILDCVHRLFPHVSTQQIIANAQNGRHPSLPVYTVGNHPYPANGYTQQIEISIPQLPPSVFTG